MTYTRYYEHDARYYKVFDSIKHYFYDLSDGECMKCRDNKPMSQLHLHHKTPKSEGGSNRRHNLMIICPPCHGDIHNKAVCSICTHLVPRNEYWNEPYWVLRKTNDPVCHECKDEVYETVDYYGPEQVID